MLLTGRICIALGPWYFGDFRNIFLPNVGEDPKKSRFERRALSWYGSTTTDREQLRLGEKGNPKYIFTIPRAILPKPSPCDKITATKSVTKTCNEIIASRSVYLARAGTAPYCGKSGLG